MSRSFAVALASMGAFLLANTASAHKVALDAGLYTLYSGPADGSHIDFDVCGQLVGSGGCYGGGILDNFESACSVLEGRPKTNENVVTRAIYILDRHLTKRASATLYVYTRTDTITDTLDQVQVTLTTQVAVGITAGQNAKRMMAANDRFLYIGTNKDPVAVSVDKKSFGLVSIQQY